MSEEPKRGGRPPKGGRRVTGRVTARGLEALDAQAAKDGRDRSDVIGDLAENLADHLGVQANQNGEDQCVRPVMHDGGMADPVYLALVNFLGSGHPLDVGEIRVGRMLVSTLYHEARVSVPEGKYTQEYWETLVFDNAPIFEPVDRFKSRFHDRASAKAWHHDTMRTLIREQEAAA